MEIYKGPTSAITQFVIECKVPYPIEYCYLQPPEDPSVTWKSFVPKSFASTKNHGTCLFEVNQFVSGTYVCGVNSIIGGQDIQTYYNVKIFTQPLQAVAESVSCKVGTTATLLGRTLFGNPIEYCYFTTPNGELIGVSERFATEGNFHFYGKGLSWGECGLNITKVADQHIGRWKSTMKVDGTEYHLHFVLTQSGGYQVAYVAAPILAAIIIGALIGTYVMYKKKQTARTYRNAGTEMDTISYASHES